MIPSLNSAKRLTIEPISCQLRFDTRGAAEFLENMQRYRIAAITLAACALCVTAWLLLRPAGRDATAAAPATRPSSATAPAAQAPDRPGRRDRAPADTPRLHRPKLTRHDANQLKDFILPLVEGRQVSLNRALGLLEEAYQEACFRSREKPLKLTFKLHDAPDHPLSFCLRGKSFLACLNHLAALAGLTVERHDSSFELIPAATAGQPAELSFQQFGPAMPKLRALAGQEPAPEEHDWEALLRSTGLILEQGTVLTPGSDGFLRLTGSAAEIARVKSALTLATEPPVQLKLATKLITAASPLDLPKTVLTEAELQQLLRDFARLPGAEVLTQPSITAAENQTAMVEIIRETAGGDGSTDWTGVKATYQTARTGLKVVTTDQSERRPEHPDDAAWLVDTDVAAYPGETHVQQLASRDGSHHYRLLTVTPIDATGRPLGGSAANPLDDVVFEDPDPAGQEPTPPPQAPTPRTTAHPVASPVPDKPGFLFSPYNNQIIDVRGIPAGTLVADPTYPAADRKFFRVP